MCLVSSMKSEVHMMQLRLRSQLMRRVVRKHRWYNFMFEKRFG